MKLTPTDWQTLVRIFEADGFTQDRIAGSHVVLSKPGVLRPVIVPKYAEVGLDVIRSNMRTAGMSRSRYFSLLEKIRTLSPPAAPPDGERAPLPYITVDFGGAGLEPLERITSLDAPHRVYDAILRDSLLDDTPFMQSEEGRRLAAAKPADATALLELSPAALLFGAWHSQGEGGGLGAKFPRALVSEIMGIDTPVEEPARRAGQMGVRATGRPNLLGDLMLVASGETEVRTSSRRTGSRIDPLGVLRKVEVFKGASASDWSTEAGKDKKKARPSEINHSNIAPTVEPLGVTCDRVEHRATITLAGLRRLRFGGGARDTAGRALIASLGLLALTEQDARGYALRSRCDLVCDGEAPLELVHADGSTEPLELDRTATRALYRASYAQAEAAGF